MEIYQYALLIIGSIILLYLMFRLRVFFHIRYAIKKALKTDEEREKERQESEQYDRVKLLSDTIISICKESGYRYWAAEESVNSSSNPVDWLGRNAGYDNSYMYEDDKIQLKSIKSSQVSYSENYDGRSLEMVQAVLKDKPHITVFRIGGLNRGFSLYRLSEDDVYRKGQWESYVLDTLVKKVKREGEQNQQDEQQAKMERENIAFKPIDDRSLFL